MIYILCVICFCLGYLVACLAKILKDSSFIDKEVHSFYND